MGQLKVYNRGLDELRNLGSGTWKWMLLKGGSFNRDHDFVADLTPASNEISSIGTPRISLSSPTRTINDTGDKIDYSVSSTSLNFGDLSDVTETPTALVLYHEVTNDSDHILVAWADLTSAPTTAVLNPYVVTLSAAIFMSTAAGSGS